VKAIWYSNAPWVGSGYGQQTSLVIPSLVADDHDVAIVANYGLQGAKLDWGGIPVYPSGWEQWSNDVIKGHALQHFGEQQGWIITLVDVFVLKGPAWGELNVASWVPVDHLPAPPAVVKFFADSKAVPIAMSEFGQDQLQRAGLDAMYAPHGIDTSIFRPGITEIRGVTPRQALGLPEDAFVVGMNAANKGNYKARKGFPWAFAAMGMFMREHPDAVLFLHTERHGMAEGFKLDRLLDACNVPEDRVFYIDQYAYRLGLQPQTMAAMYNAFDVLLAPSMGEGFGIPAIEAQSCGVPVIASDFSAQPELMGSGWLVDGVPDWDEGQGAWFHIPSVEGILAALREAYNGEGNADNARAKALEYDHNVVWNRHWRPILAELERRITLPDVEATPVNVGALG
jgi:glycosyltransferase involved in cell wall biosynthesis